MGTLKLVLVYIMYKTDDLTEEEISCKNMDSMVKNWSHTRIKSGREIDPENLLIRKPILMVTKNILQIVIAVIISTRGLWVLGVCGFGRKKKKFGFLVVVFFVVCGFSVFQRLVFAFRQKHYRDFGFGMRTGSGFSSIWAAILRLHWSRIAAKPLYAPFVTNVWDRLGFCQLGCENLSVLTILQAVFGFDRFYFCFCFLFLAVLDYFFYGFAVSNKPQCLSPASSQYHTNYQSYES